jgi:hypothetical protein
MNSKWDSHIHLFTDDMAKHPQAWGDSHKEFIWKACVAPPDRLSIQGWADINQLLKDMDRGGIEKAILLGWYWENMETCRLHNRFYAELIRKHPDRLLAFASIQPMGQDALEEITRTKDEGFSGIGEIHPQAQRFSLRDKCWQKILEHICDWNIPVNLHVTDPDSKNHPGKIETPLGDYVEMADDWPNQTFILAHLGGLLPLRDKSKDLKTTFKNVYFDCAAIPLLYESAVLPEVADRIGCEKILFGTDYPLITFPREQKQPGFVRSIEFVRGSGLTASQLELVFSTNAKRLFSV